MLLRPVLSSAKDHSRECLPILHIFFFTSLHFRTLFLVWLVFPTCGSAMDYSSRSFFSVRCEAVRATAVRVPQWWCQSNTTAFLRGDAALSIPGRERNPPVAPQAISTALYRGAALLRPPCIGMPPYSDRLISGCCLTQTALYRDAALLRPPCIGMPPYSESCHDRGGSTFWLKRFLNDGAP